MQGAAGMQSSRYSNAASVALCLWARREAWRSGLGCLPPRCAAAQCWLWPQRLWEQSEAVTGFAPADKHCAIVRGVPVWYTARASS